MIVKHWLVKIKSQKVKLTNKMAWTRNILLMFSLTKDTKNIFMSRHYKSFVTIYLNNLINKDEHRNYEFFRLCKPLLLRKTHISFVHWLKNKAQELMRHPTWAWQCSSIFLKIDQVNQTMNYISSDIKNPVYWNRAESWNLY